jgi:hypothetical protein
MKHEAFRLDIKDLRKGKLRAEIFCAMLEAARKRKSPMLYRTFGLTLAAIVALAMLSPGTPARAGGSSSKQICDTGTKSNVNFTKNITVNKNTTINKVIDNSKNITINKTIDNSKNINITKNIDNSKSININKSIVINKGGSQDQSQYQYQTQSQDQNQSQSVTVNVTGGGGGGTYIYEENQRSVTSTGGGAAVMAEASPICVPHEATVVKAIHAECIDSSGGKHPAARMLAETWVDSSTNKEIFRCLPGSRLIVTIGDVVQSDKGMAGLYDQGEKLECRASEALRHYTDGAVKCAAAEHVPDCTERTNMRRYGTGDLFFSYKTEVCVNESRSAYVGGYSRAGGSTIELNDMSLDGGVGGSY